MYIIKSPDRESIVSHHTNNLETAQVLKKYIEDKYSCTITIEERPGILYYDCPGMKCLSPKLYKVVAAGLIEAGIDDIDMLMTAFLNQEPTFEKGFMRIPSFWCNLTLSKEEFEKLKEWFTENKEHVEEYAKEATAIIIGGIKNGSQETQNKV